MKKYFHTDKQALVYVDQEANSRFWDDRWEKSVKTTKKFSSGSKHAWVVQITKKFLKPVDGLIIEGGCGLGDKVDSLRLAGYNSIGVDYASETISHIKLENPLIDVRLGDVRRLEFPDSYFVGYWSLGVIEHFWEGYSDIASEMYRIIRPGGYLFLTFPFMNRYRIKRSLKSYPTMQKSYKPDGFYQFALAPSQVTKHFESIGFKLKFQRGFSLLDGLKDEMPVLKEAIDYILRVRKKNKLTKAMYYFFNLFVEPLFGNNYGHTVLMVFKKA